MTSLRLSTSYLPTIRNDQMGGRSIADRSTTDLLLQAGIVARNYSGSFHFPPAGVRVLNKIEGVIRSHMEKHAVQQMRMSLLQSREAWNVSGRWDEFGSSMLQLGGKSEGMVLTPTNEEELLRMMGSQLKSYRDMPVFLFQIGPKYREDKRTRHGLVRSKEFIMCDAYSFHVSDDSLGAACEMFGHIYADIFAALAIETIFLDKTAFYKEFLAISQDDGETDVCRCDNGHIKLKKNTRGDKCDKCGMRYTKIKAIEMARIMKLGTFFTDAFGVTFTDRDGTHKPITMGCYGLGVTRALHAMVMQHRDDRGIAWPDGFAPFEYSVIPTDTRDRTVMTISESVSDRLGRFGPALLDDRASLSLGAKVKDADLIGCTYKVIIGPREAAAGYVSGERRRDGETVRLL